MITYPVELYSVCWQSKDLWERLGLDCTLYYSPFELERRFYKLSLIYHPDHWRDSEVTTTEAFQNIEDAFKQVMELSLTTLTRSKNISFEKAKGVYEVFKKLAMRYHEMGAISEMKRVIRAFKSICVGDSDGDEESEGESSYHSGSQTEEGEEEDMTNGH